MGDIIKRNGGYTIRWREDGRRRVMATKQASHADARRMLLEIEARVARGEAGIPERHATAWPTVAELIDRFCSEYSRPKVKDIDKYRYVARSVLKRAQALYKLSVDQVRPSDIAKIRDSLMRKRAPGTIRNLLRQLGTMFAWAEKHGLAPHNPCRGVELPAPAQMLDFLPKDEVQRLLKGAEARIGTTPTAHKLYVAIALAVHTGLRKGEILGLRWTDMDLETKRLSVMRSYRGSPKSGKARHLRLPQALIPILREWHAVCSQSSDGAVLPLGLAEHRVGGPECMLGIRELMAEIGLRSFAHPFHVLRHTFASHFVMSGGSLLALQKILGHADPKVTMIYAHLAPDFLEGEMDKVTFY